MKNKHGVQMPRYIGDPWYNTWWNKRVVSHITEDMKHQEVLPDMSEEKPMAVDKRFFVRHHRTY